MSSIPNSPEDLNVEADEIEVVDLESELEQSYIEYAMSVIVRRALPDARDGLKPVQRRILYAMDEEGVGSSSGHRKSSSVVGETMGNFHPHGDASIYDSLVRMSQEFSLRVPLVDGQGNFGSIDGDPPAAMRYTEARMSQYGEMLLNDLHKDTVDFSENYDGRLEEPDVLPSAFPNLLINGSEGIAVGVSTKIPPHNPGEVIDAVTHYIDNPDADVDELMEFVKGPDFPTGGKIIGTNAIESAYKTGRGKLTVRGDYHIEESDTGNEKIIITEIPFEDRNRKSDLVDDIATLVSDGKLEGIRDLRDESDEGIRIVIETKQSAIPEIVANRLVSEVLERTFGVIMLALVNGEPRVLSLKEVLDEYIKHRREVIRRRTQHELDEAEDRAHILEGRLKALENADSIVDMIQDAEDRDEAKSELQSQYDFSEEQAAHIVRMQLGSLTSMESNEIEEEYETVTNNIERYNEILNSKSELDDVVKDELQDVRDKFSAERLERKTQIVEDEAASTMSKKDFIAKENQIVVFTNNNYVKRMDFDEITEYSRGSKGLQGINLRNEDQLRQVHVCSTHDELYVITRSGQIHSISVFDLPEQSRNSRGTPLVNVIDIEKEDDIAAIYTTEELPEQGCLTFVTKNGKVKQTSVEEYDNIYSSGIRGISLGDDDEVVDVFYCASTSDTIMLTTKDGQTIRFEADDVRVTGRNTQGVNGIKLGENDEVVSGCVVDEDDLVLTVTEHGYGKFTNEDKYSIQSRYGKGVKAMNMCERNGKIVESLAVSPEEKEEYNLLVSLDDGRVVRTPLDQISTVGRLTKGVKLVDADGDIVTGASTGTEEVEDDE